MEKKIRVSTKGRVTIPKPMRETLKIADGQPVIIKSLPGRKELVIEILATIPDFEKGAVPS